MPFMHAFTWNKTPMNNACAQRGSVTLLALCTCVGLPGTPRPPPLGCPSPSLSAIISASLPKPNITGYKDSCQAHVLFENIYHSGPLWQCLALLFHKVGGHLSSAERTALHDLHLEEDVAMNILSQLSIIACQTHIKPPPQQAQYFWGHSIIFLDQPPTFKSHLTVQHGRRTISTWDSPGKDLSANWWNGIIGSFTANSQRHSY